MRGVLLLLVTAASAAAAFYGARYWQSQQEQYRRVAPAPDCDLRAGPCARQLDDGGRVTLAITPADIPLMKTLTLSVAVNGRDVSGVDVDIRGLNMDMGLNRTRLQPTADGAWQGETILPVCSQRRMEWEAAVRLQGDDRVEAPFLFHTERP